MCSFLILLALSVTCAGFPVTEVPDPDFSDFDIPDTVEDLDPVAVVEMFIQFERAYHKEYRSPLEQAKARSTFQQNLISVIRLNEQYSNESLEFGINYYSDFSDLEFAEKVANLHPDGVGQANKENSILFENENAKNPVNFDWRSKNNTIGGVSNQGYCGCSWGYTVSSVVQSAFSIKNGKFLEPSEQQLCDCAQGGNSGCAGGSLKDGLEYVKQNGLTLEQNYQRNVEQTTDVCQVNKDTIKVSNYQFISPTSSESLQKTLLAKGPIGVGFKVSNTFRHYKSGIFNLNDCEHEQFIGWHSVVIVGYGTDEKSGEQFWIAKNSWSPSFGEEGYFRISKGADLCEIESKMPVYVEL